MISVHRQDKQFLRYQMEPMNIKVKHCKIFIKTSNLKISTFKISKRRHHENEIISHVILKSSTYLLVVFIFKLSILNLFTLSMKRNAACHQYISSAASVI